MTVNNTQVRNEYIANPGQTVFSYTFRIFSATDLNVYVVPDGDVPTDSIHLRTDYTVQGVGDTNGGTITFNSGLAGNDLVIIQLRMAFDRNTDLQQNGDILAGTLNIDSDRNVQMTKQNRENLDNRVLRFQEAEPRQGKDNSIPSPRPLSFFRWDETGSFLETVTPDEIATSTVFSDFKNQQFLDGVDYVSGTTAELSLSESAGLQGNTQVYFDGVYQEKTEYVYNPSNLRLIFNEPIRLGTTSVEVVYGRAVPQADIEASKAAAQASADAAAVSAGNALTSEQAAQAAQTGAEDAAVTATNAANAAQLNADQTALDATQTAADRTQTGLDVTSAAASASNADDSANLAEDWAESPTEPGGPGTKSAKTSAEEAAASAASIDSVNLKSGRKNYIINGNLNTPIINQREFAGGQPAAGVYGYDRWKGDATGTQIEQIVENSEVINGTFTISWVGGTGTATVDGVAGLSSGDSFTLNTTGNFSVIVPTDATYVQLEKGDFATEFEYRTETEELNLCLPYAEAGLIDQVLAGFLTSNGVIFGDIYFKSKKISTPTLIATTESDSFKRTISGSFITIPAGEILQGSATTESARVGVSNTTTNVIEFAQYRNVRYFAESEL